MHLLYLLDLFLSRTIAPFCLFLAIVSAVACDKVPLLAPTESTINLTVSTTTMAANGTAQVIATVVEKGGIPVQNGTMVTFTGSLGNFEPVDAATNNGKAVTTFRANGTSGTAKIGAISGGAKATEIEVKIGSAAVETVTLRADPASVSTNGGTVSLVASVVDVSGNALPGASVVFSTDNGQLGSSTVSTDGNGEARTTLTTNRTSIAKARVGAKEGTVTINATTVPTVAITTTPANPLVGVPVTFTVTPGAIGTTGNPIRNVVLDFGDGTPTHSFGPLAGAASVQHIYTRAGTFTVAATATDTAGLQSESRSTVSILRPIVNVSFTNPPASGQIGAAVTFAVAVTNPSGASLTGVVVSFGDGQSASLPPSGGSALHTYTTAGTYTVTATAVDITGATYSTTHVIRIDPATAFNVTLDAQSGDPAVQLSCVPATGYPKTCNAQLVGIGDRIVFTAGGTPPGFSSIVGYEWTWGDGSPVERTTSNSMDHIFRSTGEFIISVSLVTTGGSSSQRLTLIITP
jgi:PKD repeat protein